MKQKSHLDVEKSSTKLIILFFNKIQKKIEKKKLDNFDGYWQCYPSNCILSCWLEFSFQNKFQKVIKKSEGKTQTKEILPLQK